MKRPQHVQVRSARILPDSIRDKPRVELSRAWKVYHAEKPNGGMPASANCKLALRKGISK